MSKSDLNTFKFDVSEIRSGETISLQVVENAIRVLAAVAGSDVSANFNKSETKLSNPSSRRSKKRGRKGLSQTERKIDKRVYDSWIASGYRTYKEFADKHDHSLPDVRKRIGRERKRRERSKNRFDSI